MKTPNFLVIITDQQRADTMGAYGASMGGTPYLDNIARTGVVFNRGYCNNPLCMPSRAAVLTGRYPSSSGVRTNGVVARPGQALLPRLLSEAGYRTAAFGKIHYHPCGGNTTQYWPENIQVIKSGKDLTQPYLGFQNIALACGHGDVVPGLHEEMLLKEFPEIYEKRGTKGALSVPDELLLHSHKIETYQTAIPEELYPTSWVADRTIEYLESVDGPFFVWCGINDPHHPFKPPGHYWDMFKPEDVPPPLRRQKELEDKPPHFQGFYDGKYKGLDTDGFLLGSKDHLTDDRVRMIRAAYYGMVAMIDDQVNRILNALDNSGQRENTIVIFMSDHGEYLGDHGFMLKGPMHYESLLRVPFIWNWPGHFPAGQQVTGPVGLIDTFPTILDLAGVTIPQGTQGKSLMDQLYGRSMDRAGEVYIENDVDRLNLRLRTIVTERWKLTWYAGEDYGEIYDLEEDPDEFVNLWGTCDPKIKSELTGRLLDLMVVNQDELPPKLSHA